MTLMIISGVLMSILIASMVYEPRNYRNALILMMAVDFFLIGFGSAPGIQGKIVATIMVLIPVDFVAAAVFLIINGFVMIKKEGHNLRNILSLLTGVDMIAGSIATVFALIRFQGRVFGKKLKMKAAGVGCRTAAYYWPSAFIREYILVMLKYKWGL